MLRAEIEDGTVLYVSTIARQTYDEHVEDDNLGGDEGYFVIRTRMDHGTSRFEVLAKASNFDAAGDIFDMIVGASNRGQLPA